MFGFGSFSLNEKSNRLINNIQRSFASQPMYANYTLSIENNLSGVKSLIISKNGRIVNRFDFYGNSDGDIASIAIYGGNLRGHLNAILSSNTIFGLPVSDAEIDDDYVDVQLDNYSHLV